MVYRQRFLSMIIVISLWATLAIPLDTRSIIATQRLERQAAFSTSPGALQIVAGSSHTCAVMSDSQVACWGYNYWGQLGDGTVNSHSLPHAVIGLDSPVTALAVGGSHTCALVSGGGVKCWGDNYGGTLGDGSTTQRLLPVDVVGLTSGVSALAASYSHTCAALSSGGAKCWGDNYSGALGDGTTTTSLIPVDVIGLTGGVNALALGYSHTCALVNSGGVKCWGANYSGQLGDGTTTDHLTPVDVVGLSSGVTALAASDSSTCALLASGAIRCWGDNFWGQLGDGTRADRSTPVDVAGLSSGVTAVTTGGGHTCASVSSGGVKCWGRNDWGQLGDGSTTDRTTPVDVVNLSDSVNALAAGGGHTCALVGSGGVKCWGDNYSGQLGNGLASYRTTPVKVAELNGQVKAIASADNHLCVQLRNDEIQCWGSGVELGDGSTADYPKPVAVAGIGSVTSVLGAGGTHSCLRQSNGGVTCWGQNDRGQLGDGTTNTSLTPVAVVGLNSEVKSLIAGWSHTCVLLTNNSVTCWGKNAQGQLGNGDSTDSPLPVAVLGLNSGVVALAGYRAERTCALFSGGNVKCWGDSPLGNGSFTPSSLPIEVIGLESGISSVAAGLSHTCAAISSGGIKCWGSNYEGQLGDGTTEYRTTPVEVVGLHDIVTDLAMGYFHTCALLKGGEVKCWGANYRGQVGDNTTIPRSTPVSVVSLDGPAIGLVAGSFHTCALIRGGDVQCWGSNASGEMGDGSLGYSTEPVDVKFARLFLPFITTTSILVRQPVWERVGTGNLDIATLALTGDQLFVGDRRAFDQGGGLYKYNSTTCDNIATWSRLATIQHPVFDLTFQGAQGVAATFRDNGIFYSSDHGNNWLQTNSGLGKPFAVTSTTGPGTIYAGTEENGIYQSGDGGGAWVLRSENPKLINVMVMRGSVLWAGADVVTDAEGNITDASQAGVWKLPPGSNVPAQLVDGLNNHSRRVWDFAFRGDDEIYIATFDGVYQSHGGAWQPFGLQGMQLLNLEIAEDYLYAGARDFNNQGMNAGVWRRSFNSDGWEQVSSPGWDNTYTVRDIVYDPAYCQGLIVGTDDGVWVYR